MEKTKKTSPIYRKCIVTSLKTLQEDLYRVVVINKKEILLDKEQNMAGRGFYFKKDKEVITKLLEGNFLEKELYRYKIKLNFDKKELLKDII